MTPPAEGTADGLEPNGVGGKADAAAGLTGVAPTDVAVASEATPAGKAPLRVVIVNGSPSDPATSKTVALADLAADEVRERWDATVARVDVYAIGPDLTGAILRDDAGPQAGRALALVEGADLLLVAVPVFRGSYPGMFKHFLDLIEPYALAGKPTLLLATGGSERHLLVIDHELRPLFAFFQAFVAPVGVYVGAESFDGTLILDPAVQTRLRLALGDLVPLLGPTR